MSKELDPDYLIIEEKKGREIAKVLGIKIIGLIGLIGVLLEAKEAKVINKVKPILDELIQKAGFRISKNLYSYILKQIDE